MSRRGSWTRRPMPAHAIAQRKQHGRVTDQHKRKKALAYGNLKDLLASGPIVLPDHAGLRDQLGGIVAVPAPGNLPPEAAPVTRPDDEHEEN